MEKARYRVKKNAVFPREQKMVKRIGLSLLVKKIKVLATDQSKWHTFLGCAQADKHDVRRAVQGVKKEKKREWTD